MTPFPSMLRKKADFPPKKENEKPYRRLNVPRSRKGIRQIHQLAQLLPRRPRQHRLQRTPQNAPPPRPQRRLGHDYQGGGGDGGGGSDHGRVRNVWPAEERVHGFAGLAGPHGTEEKRAVGGLDE